MIVYYAYFQEYEDIRTIGIFSSKELAEQALTHWCAKQDWFERRQGYVEDYEIDNYITTNMSPLAIAMEENNE